MDSFIQNEIRKNQTNNHEYEDVIVQGQIIEAKEIIRSAIKYNKNYVSWYYVFEEYDSYIMRHDSVLDKYFNDAAYKTDPRSTAGEFNWYNGICSYLEKRVFNSIGSGGTELPKSFDYDYVNRKIKIELENLGCKQVELFIGPITLTDRKPVGKKSFFTGEYKYQEFTVDVVKWMISVSW